MNSELIAAINRLASAQEKLAEAKARIADALHHTEGTVESPTFADGLLWQLSQLGSSLDQIAENMPVPPETD